MKITTLHTTHTNLHSLSVEKVSASNTTLYVAKYGEQSNAFPTLSKALAQHAADLEHAIQYENGGNV